VQRDSGDVSSVSRGAGPRCGSLGMRLAVRSKPLGSLPEDVAAPMAHKESYLCAVFDVPFLGTLASRRALDITPCAPTSQPEMPASLIRGHTNASYEAPSCRGFSMFSGT
jgi:hypothetical protein